MTIHYITLLDSGSDFEVPGSDSGNAFSSVCSCVVSKHCMLVQLLREKVAALSI